MLTKRAILGAVIGLPVILLGSAGACAQSYPNRVIKMILPFPPGGPTDTTARMLARPIVGVSRPTIVVENRPGGAGGTVGAKSVATAEPDGYTLLLQRARSAGHRAGDLQERGL